MWLGDQNQPTTESGPVQVVVTTLKNDEMREEFSPTAGLTGSMKPADRLIFLHKQNLLGFTSSVRGDGTSESPGYVSSRIFFVLNSSDTNFKRESRKIIFQSLFYR